MRRKMIYLIFVFISFFFLHANVSADYKASDFENEKCITSSIPDDAASIYNVDSGIFSLSGTSYGTYKSIHQEDEVNDDGSGSGYANEMIDDTFIYFSTSKDKKTLYAYVPNYSAVVKDKEILESLKAMGLYNEKFVNCNSTYFASARVLVYKDKDDDLFKNENYDTFEIINVRHITYLLILILMVLIVINIVKNKNKKRLVIYLILLALSLIFLAFSFNSSYALGKNSKVKNVKSLSVTSSSIYLSFDTVSGAKSYEVCYKTNSSNSYRCNLIVRDGKALVKGLDNDTYYNIKIRAKDNYSYGLYSDVFKFRTLKKDEYYYYLNKNEKIVYNQVYNGMKKRNKNIGVSPVLNKKDFNKVYHYVRIDHPELFYVDIGYHYYYDYKGNVAEIFKYYNSTFNNYANSKKKFDTYTNKILSKAKTYKTDYEKEQYVAYYLARNVKYNDKLYKKYRKRTGWNDNFALMQSAYSSIVNKNTFCAGYSASFKYLMSRLGISSYTIGGLGKRYGSSGDHAWNLVKLDDGYYNVDITWIRKNSKRLNLSYFNQSGNKFNTGHVRDKYDKVVPYSIGNLYLNFNGNNVIDLSKNKSTILKGKSKKIKVRVDSKYTKKSKLRYKSSNKNIIKVNKKGKLKALKTGKAKITVYTKEGIKSSKVFTVKKKLICEKYGSSYYGKKGKKVSVSKYYNECNPKCLVKNNIYYNNVGRPVGETNYYMVCSGKCVHSGNIYYDKDGKKVGSNEFYKSCNPKCKKENNSYYDKNGKPVSEREYNVSCLSDNGNFNVTFNYGKKSVDKKVKAGTVVNEPETPEKKGYTFDGWYKDEDYSIEYDFNSTIDNDFVIYAKFTKEKYTVHFETNTDSIIEDIEVSYNDLVTKPFDPVKEGYYFTGWYIDSELTTKYSFMTPVSSDLTLYAGYSLEEVTTHEVTFVPGNGHDSFIVDVYDGEKVEVPVISSNDEYVFDKWYSDSTKEVEYDFDTPVTEDIVLYGSFKTKDGQSIIEAPDTASRFELIVIISGVLFIIIGIYYIFKRYNIKIKKK